MFVHVLFFFPETKGKRLEEIGQIWDEGVPAWKFTKWQPAVPILSDEQLGEKLQTQHVENDEKLIARSLSSYEHLASDPTLRV